MLWYQAAKPTLNSGEGDYTLVQNKFKTEQTAEEVCCPENLVKVSVHTHG